MSRSQTTPGAALLANHGSINPPALLIRTVPGQIIQWSPAMAERYGFTSAEALGQVADQLLRTSFWKPRHEIQAMLLDQKSWSGGLIHRHADGRPLMTADQWYLHRGVGGGEPLITELHSDLMATGTAASDQLADVIGIVGHELREPLTAVSNYINAANRVRQSARPDQERGDLALKAAAEQVARLKDGMALFSELAGMLRPSSGPAHTRPTEQAETAPPRRGRENDHL
jgi:hypothetical protein